MIRKIIDTATPAGDQAPSPKEPKRSLVQAVNRLRRSIPDLEVDYHETYGDVRWLTSPTGLYNAPFAGDPVAHARACIETAAVRKVLGLDRITVVFDIIEEVAGSHRVKFRQEVKLSDRTDPLHVFGGFVIVTVASDGRISSISSTLRQGRKTPKLGRILSEADAVAKAKEKLAEVMAKEKVVLDEATTLLGKLRGAKRLDRAIARVTTNLGQILTETRVSQVVAEMRPFAEGADAEVTLGVNPYQDPGGEKLTMLDPIYKVVLSVGEPRKLMLFYVKAKTGEVVYTHNLLHFAIDAISEAAASAQDPSSGSGTNTGSGATTSGVKVKSFLRIPDPNVDLLKQAHDATIDSLPDKTVLKNDLVVVYMGGTKKEVKAKADGTFNYNPGDPEFAAVVTFFALDHFLRLMIKLGLKKPSGPIPVYVHDSKVRDNAYFDPQIIEIRIGVGSGLRRGGLNVNIAFDMGVTWHETGHYIVFLQTPGQDLPGGEGGAMHESSGDVLGNLLMNFLFRLWFAKALGQTFTVTELLADRCVIGEYALPPDGIRIQKNSKKTPKDKTGEVHDDGLISGGAHRDLLVAMASAPGVDLETGLLNFARLYLKALSLVPAHKVTFKDMLRALITADQDLFKGVNRSTIEKAHADHGITLATGQAAKKTTRRRKR